MPLAYPDPPLCNCRLLLRPWGEADLPLLEWASVGAYVATIEHLPVPFSSAADRAWIASQHALVDGGRGWAFAIVERASGDAVGGIGIVLPRPPGVAEPGAWVIGARRNGGIADRATRLVCMWALTGDTGIERIQATVEPWNAASRRVLEKVGFVREGVLRSYASWRGGRHDAVLYSLLRSDLDQQAAAAGPRRPAR